MPDPPPGGSDADRGSAPDAGRYRMLVIATALTVAGAFTAFTYLSPFLTEVSGFSEAAVGPILLVRGLAGLVGVLLAGALAGRHLWWSMVVLVGGQMLALAAQYAWGANQAAAVVATSAAGLVLSGMTTVLAARLLEVAPDTTDLASAGVSTAFNVGITAGALVGSFLLTNTGVRSSALVGALLTAAALTAVLAEPRLATRRPARTAPRIAPPPCLWQSAAGRN
jgi:predicted MFS family arabinose efflux permease